MSRAFVAVGSNISPAANLTAAVGALASHVHITAISTVYCTEPEGRPEQPLFYNCVVEVRTEIPPWNLKFEVLRPIEDSLGRQRTSDRFAPRTIDLDLILFDDLVVHAGGLTLPDPDISRRSFIAVPLSELAPDLELPGTSSHISELAATLPAHRMRPLRFYTFQLRKRSREIVASRPRLFPSGN